MITGARTSEGGRATLPRLAAVILVSALMTAALGWLARAPYRPPGGDMGLLRLSWRLRGERIETCRPRTPAELDALPVHMRTPEVCEGRLVAYLLVVRLDDAPPDTVRVLPGGARGDRPVFVLHELRLEPGPHRVRVSFEREEDTGLAEARSPLAIDTVLDVTPGAIELITLDAAARRFVHLSPTSL